MTYQFRPGKKQGSIPPAAEKTATTGRQLAYLILKDVFEKNEYISLCLDRHFRISTIPLIEKRLCTKIVYSVFDNLIQLDYILSFFLNEPEKLDLSVINVLRIGLCQLRYFERIPDNAAVDESVKLIKWTGSIKYAALVNAVLRKCINESSRISWPSEEEPEKYISIRDSVSLDLAALLVKEYGFSKAHEICSFRGEHSVTIRPNTMVFSSDEAFEQFLSQKVWQCEKSDVCSAWHVKGISNAGKDIGFQEGKYSIEGISSMLAAEAVCVKAGMNVLDCCAAPGGKTAYMAERMNNTGRIIAWDIHPHRVDLIRATAKRLNLDNVRPCQFNAAVLKKEYEKYFDRVLIDAPCSGTGVMDDKPDIKMHFDLSNLQELIRTQEEILDTCSNYVKQNGLLVYATCSVLKAEGEEQIKRFTDKHSDFVLESVSSFEDKSFFDRECAIGYRILPGAYKGLDGFYIAVLRRN